MALNSYYATKLRFVAVALGNMQGSLLLLRSLTKNMENNRIVLLDLPNNISYSIISNWIPLNALGRFDSALSRSQYRAEFLALLADPITIFEGVLEDFGSISWDLYYWIINRRIKISELLISNTMSSMHPDVLAQFFEHVGPHLRTLKTNEFFVSAHVCELIGSHCPHLEHVEFHGSAVKRKYMKAFIHARTATLRQLKLCCPKYIGADFFRDQLFWHLEMLNVRGGAELLHAISAACPQLRTLRCGPPIYQLIQTAPFDAVLPMPTLESVKFKCVKNLKDSALSQLLQVCPNITDVDLDGCTGLTAAALGEIANHCSQLVTLRLRNMARFTIAGLREVIMQCGDTLQVLQIADCAAINGVELSELVSSTNGVEVL